MYCVMITRVTGTCNAIYSENELINWKIFGKTMSTKTFRHVNIFYQLTLM